jgi:hypothetical protein
METRKTELVTGRNQSNRKNLITTESAQTGMIFFTVVVSENSWWFDEAFGSGGMLHVSLLFLPHGMSDVCCAVTIASQGHQVCCQFCPRQCKGTLFLLLLVCSYGKVGLNS